MVDASFFQVPVDKVQFVDWTDATEDAARAQRLAEP